MRSRNCSSVNGVRPTPSTSNVGLVQPIHARSYRAGISFRFVRSPVPPKIINRHEPALGSEDCTTLNASVCVAILTSSLLVDVLPWLPIRPNRYARGRRQAGRCDGRCGRQNNHVGPASGFAAIVHSGNCQNTRAKHTCLLYTSDAADEEDSVDLGG